MEHTIFKANIRFIESYILKGDQLQAILEINSLANKLSLDFEVNRDFIKHLDCMYWKQKHISLKH